MKKYLWAEHFAVNEKVRDLLCLIRSLFERPLVAREIVDLLSWKRVAGPSGMPCCMQYSFVQSTCESESEMPINSASVDGHVAIFCFGDFKCIHYHDTCY